MKISLFNKYLLLPPVTQNPKSDAGTMTNAEKPISEMDSVDLVIKMYGEVRAYDLHYSTMRSTLTTFLVGLGLGIGTYIVSKTIVEGGIAPSPAMALIGLIGPTAIFLIAMVISAYFQRLTKACEIIETRLETQLRDCLSRSELKEPKQLLYRHQLKKLIDGNEPTEHDTAANRKLGLWKPYDLMQQCLIGFIILYIVVIGWLYASELQCFLPGAACPSYTSPIVKEPAGGEKK